MGDKALFMRRLIVQLIISIYNDGNYLTQIKLL